MAPSALALVERRRRMCIPLLPDDRRLFPRWLLDVHCSPSKSPKPCGLRGASARPAAGSGAKPDSGCCESNARGRRRPSTVDKRWREICRYFCDNASPTPGCSSSATRLRRNPSEDHQRVRVEQRRSAWVHAMPLDEARPVKVVARRADLPVYSIASIARKSVGSRRAAPAGKRRSGETPGRRGGYGEQLGHVGRNVRST